LPKAISQRVKKISFLSLVRGQWLLVREHVIDLICACACHKKIDRSFLENSGPTDIGPVIIYY